MELKIKCQCGVKYVLDITSPDPIRFVCQYCGVDSSAAMSEIVRQQFASSVVVEPASSAPIPPATPSVPVESLVPKPPSAGSRLKVHAHAPAASQQETSSAASTSGEPCRKHPGFFAQDECVVCHKPICPKCMELFGYLCSAYCHGQAEKLKIDVPVYAGQKTQIEAKYWRKVRWISAAAVLVVLALIGAYGWFYFVGSRPRLVYSVKFPGSEESNFARMIGQDEVLLRRGNLLSRYDLKADKTVWSLPLVQKEEVDKAAKDALVERKAQMAKWKAQRAKLKTTRRASDDDDDMGMAAAADEKPRSDAEELRDISKWIERGLLSQTQVRLAGANVWVISPNRATQYELRGGKEQKQVTNSTRVIRIDAGLDDSVLLVSQGSNGKELFSRLDLATGDLKAEQIAQPPAQPAPTAARSARAVAAKGTLPVKATVASGVPGVRAAALQPAVARMAMDAEGDPFPVIPGDDSSAPREDIPATGMSMVFAGENVAEVEVKLIQKNFVQYKAIKDKPKVSELDRGVNAANAVAAMSEVMNDIQAEKTGGMRTEDESRYSVTIRRHLSAGIPEWTGDVVGPPALFPFRTVDVLAAGKGITVFDKANKKLWESKLAYPVNPGLHAGVIWKDGEGTPRVPGEERGQILYFFDQGVLTAFETSGGNVRWRLPSVGISGLQFDSNGMIYVSTTSASAENLKYSQQVDLSKRIDSVILKVDSATGKILWKVNRTGSDIYLSGKYLYTIEAVPAGGMRIYRLNPSNGKPLWEHYEKQYSERCAFDGRTIQLLHNNELQVLRFLSL